MTVAIMITMTFTIDFIDSDINKHIFIFLLFPRLCLNVCITDTCDEGITICVIFAFEIIFFCIFVAQINPKLHFCCKKNENAPFL